MSEHPAPVAVWVAAKEAHFSLTSSRALNHELHDLGQIGLSEGIKGMQTN